MALERVFCVSIALLMAGGACSRISGSAPASSSRPVESPHPAAAGSQGAQLEQPKLRVSVSGAPATLAVRPWNFEDDAPAASPSGFSFGRTGKGREGHWVVRTEGEGKVLAQVDADDTNFRFPFAVANEPSLRDVRVSVRCKMVSGEVDRACGLVARFKNAENYVVTRANALENNVRLYTVRDGRRDEIASFTETVSPNAWHDYRLELRGDTLEVFWNGKRVIERRDSTFMDAGRAGLWTKADSVTYFDDFSVEPL